MFKKIFKRSETNGKSFKETNQYDNKVENRKYTCVNIANIYYPKRKKIYQSETQINYSFVLDTGESLSLEVSAISKYRYLYANEKLLIAKIRTNTFSISYDEGESFKKEKTLEDIDIFQIYPLSNGNYLVGGMSLIDNTQSYIYTLDKNLNILAKHTICRMVWHSQNAIDENNSIIMFAEYENSKATPPEKISIFRSKDFGLTWEEVFSLNHPSEMKHWHTLQKDPYRPNYWLATGGDIPEQSRWFLSKDNGDTWQEITDTNYCNEDFPAYSLSAHRTTAIEITEDYYYFSTDDLMGGPREYFLEHKQKRQSSSKLYRASKTEPITLEYISNIGLHGRSMIDIGHGYIIITEGKYATYNTQVYYTAKNNSKKVYFLFDIYGYKRHPGTASKNSKLIHNKYFYTPITKGLFFSNPKAISLKWSLDYKILKENIEYHISEYMKFEEHLWFFDNIHTIKNIMFKGNSVNILPKRGGIFHLILGGDCVNTLLPKELFKLNPDNDTIEISFLAKLHVQTTLECHLQFFTDNDNFFNHQYTVSNGHNKIIYKKKEEEKYLRIFFIVDAEPDKEIILSDLNINFLEKNNETTKEITYSLIERKENNTKTYNRLKNDLLNQSKKGNESYLIFQKNQWTIDNKGNFKEVNFTNNTLNFHIDLSTQTNAVYIRSNYINIQNSNSLKILYEAQFNETHIKLYIVEFSHKKEKISTQSYQVKKGKNTHKHKTQENTVYIKVLFRFDNTEIDKVLFKNLFVYSNNLIPKHIIAHIIDLTNLPEKKILPKFIYNSKLKKYTQQSKNNIIESIVTWGEEYIEKQNFNFMKEKELNPEIWDTKVIAFRALKIAFAFEHLIKSNHANSIHKANTLYKLILIHIEALYIQTREPKDGCVYAFHGLFRLLRLFPDNIKIISSLKEACKKEISYLFYQDFYIEGICKKNSSKEHLMAVELYDNIIDNQTYHNFPKLIQSLQNAKTNCAYMIFPNNELLAIGDTDLEIINTLKEKTIKEGITYFKESGYTYIYETVKNPSMLFFDTAFLNKKHRHADLFNLLLYEYGRNILVDAGKYSEIETNPLRRYCISTHAHNSILINNESYILDEKNYFSSKLMKTEKTENYFFLNTLHCYDNIHVSHNRNIFYKPKEFLCVVDILISDEINNLKQLFHLHEEIELFMENGCFVADITDDTEMSISMLSLDINNNNVASNMMFSKGLDDPVQGYRAISHNEIVENHVLINEKEGKNIVLGCIFTFNKQPNINLNYLNHGVINVEFDIYNTNLDINKLTNKSNIC